MTLNVISPSDFARLTKQANLKLTAKEATHLRTQLEESLAAIQVLQQLDTSQITQTTSASGLTNVLRPDVVKPSLSQESALQNAKDTHMGYFVVPAIFEAQDN